MRQLLEAGQPTLRHVFRTRTNIASGINDSVMADSTEDNILEAQPAALSGTNSPDNQLAHITHVLQVAVSGQDRGQATQILPVLLQHLSLSPQQRHLPLATGLLLLQLGAQALHLAAGNLQVTVTHLSGSI